VGTEADETFADTGRERLERLTVLEGDEGLDGSGDGHARRR
jgi:hypothetical protein